MKIGIPKEIKNSESRVALLPSACSQLIELGHEVLIEAGSGLLSGYNDNEYKAVGCHIVESIEALYQHATLIVKVKEPQQEEYKLLNKHHTLFCYLHLAAEPQLQQALKQSHATAIAFEEVVDDQGNLPLLKPMSIIAGKLAAQYACVYLHSHQGGRGVLVDNVGEADKAKVTVLGYGVSGHAAAEHFANMGAALTVIDKDPAKLDEAIKLGPDVSALNAMTDNIEHAVCESDIIVGAVLIPGARAPVVVKKEWVANMPKGAVIVDIAVDQGGCIETTKPTTYENPIYSQYGVIHFGVQNMPAAVPRTASQLISNAISPAVTLIASGVWESDANIKAGLCVQDGRMIK